MRRTHATGANRRVPVLLMLAFIATLSALGAPGVSAQGRSERLPGAGPISIEGELEVSYEDDEARGTARLVHVLKALGARVPLKFPGKTPEHLQTGDYVSVSGDLADGTLTTTSVTTLAVSASQTLGPRSVLVILFNFSNNPTQPFSASTVANVNTQVRNYYLENSYGLAELTFTVVGWYTIAATDAGCDYYTWATQAEGKASAAGVNLSAYDRRVFAFPKASSCSWTGMGNLGGVRSWSNGSYTVRTIAHEQGHNFGNHHSRAIKCDAAACRTVEYGDDRDVMGRPGTVAHMNAFQKERLGWLNYGSAPGVQTVASSGDYWIDNYEGAAGYTKALKIWNPAKSSYYYVESRAKTGFDATVAAGVTLHSAVSGSSYQLDLDPATTGYDSTLDAGQIFSDGAIGLSVQTLSADVSGAMVRVTLGSAASCTPHAPTVALTGVGPTFTVTVKNNNSPACAASAVALAVAAPTDWSTAFSPASLTLASGAAGTAALTLTAPTGTSGTYAFSVTATDLVSGKSASASGSIVLTEVCVAATPSVSLKATGPTTYAVALKNNNGSACAPSLFAMSAAVASGWTASFSPASATLAPGSSVSAMLTLTPPSSVWGTFPFTVTATDAGSGLSGSTTGSATLAAPASLVVTASASFNSRTGKYGSVSIDVSATNGSQHAVGATITVVVTRPTGVTSTFTATAGKDGAATVKFFLAATDPPGVYQVLATASTVSATARALTSFTVR